MKKASTSRLWSPTTSQTAVVSRCWPGSVATYAPGRSPGRARPSRWTGPRRSPAWDRSLRDRQTASVGDGAAVDRERLGRGAFPAEVAGVHGGAGPEAVPQHLVADQPR